MNVSYGPLDGMTLRVGNYNDNGSVWMITETEERGVFYRQLTVMTPEDARCIGRMFLDAGGTEEW